MENSSRTQPQAIQDIDDSLDVLNQTELIDDIKTKCINGVPLWKNVSPSNLQVAVVSGGCSNYIFRVSNNDQNQISNTAATTAVATDTVLVRIFGSGLTDLGIDRETESLCQSLAHSQGISPKCISSFEGGRIEEFVANARTWSMYDLRQPNRADLLATMMGKLHATKHPSFEDKSPMLPNRLRDWAEAAKEAATTIVKRQDRNARLTVALDVEGLCSQEVPWLIETLESLDSHRVLSHNDFNAGNILEVEGMKGPNDEVGPFYVVDFEYSGFDWRGYDIANFFNEMCTDNQCPAFPHFVIDPGAFPSPEFQSRFLRQYLISFTQASGQDESQVETAVNDQEVEKLRKEVELFAIASNLQWALWSIVQEDRSTISFGFLDYAIQRMSLYFAKKAELGY